MKKKPDDRPKPADLPKPAPEEIEEPKIYAMVDGNKIMRPGLETFFADPKTITDSNDTGGCICNPVVTTYCSCNKVSVCSCVGYRSCSCVGHESSSGSSRSGCRCAPVH